MAKNKGLYLHAHDSRKIIYGVTFLVHINTIMLVFGIPINDAIQSDFDAF